MKTTPIVLALSLAALASIPVAAVSQQAYPNYTTGSLNWNANVKQEGENYVRQRVGKCTWDLEFDQTGADEMARSLSYKNTDTYYPYGLHNPPQLGDQKVVEETDGGINTETSVNGRLSYRRTKNGGYTFSFAMPSYPTSISLKHTYAWDSFRRAWVEQDGSPTTGTISNVYCGPNSIYAAQVQNNGRYVIAQGSFNGVAQSADLNNNVVLVQQVPKANEDYKWWFSLPCGPQTPQTRGPQTRNQMSDQAGPSMTDQQDTSCSNAPPRPTPTPGPNIAAKCEWYLKDAKYFENEAAHIGWTAPLRNGYARAQCEYKACMANGGDHIIATRACGIPLNPRCISETNCP